MSIAQIGALVVGLFLALAAILGHLSLLLVTWSVIALCLAILFGGKAVPPSA